MTKKKQGGLKVKINCCLCSQTTTKQVIFPEGWQIAYANVVEEDLGFCPAHAHVEVWRKENCGDCGESWGSCSLWKAFAYKKKEMDREAYKTIEDGFCPKKNKKETLLVRPLSIQRGGYNLSEAIKRYGRTCKK